MGALFRLLRQYTGLSQTRIATATGIPQGRVSEIIRDKRAVGAKHVFERIANGLNMPDPARLALGLAPHQRARPSRGWLARHDHGPGAKPTSYARSPRPAVSTA